jgi:general stress protein 26
MNGIMKPLLRSPLHFLVSSWCMLITVKGRKTDRLYTTPVYYRREANTIRFFTGKSLRWVKNLADGASVTLVLRGKKVSGTAIPCQNNPELRQKWLQIMYPRMSSDKAADLVLVEVQV